MEHGASGAQTTARTRLADVLGPDALKGPGVLALAAAGHVALITNARPQTIPTVWEMATLNPVLAVGSLVVLALVAVQLSRLFERRMFLVRRATIGLIAGCLCLLAGELMNLLSVGQQPWAAVIAGATVLVLVGGLTTLIADVRTLWDR